ncbi:C-type lectin 37Da-like [Drosophila nasuta]|uniref:C-type lectin 37Da-like n=1 Tax=Drosophila albomicans TaxID=7291 RepID=A0A6P8Y0R7_DROAB|nr:C-type lectin 37Da-like [Drosophila albomicans]XP_060661386.1 C-type lectin 37Da-like [Drosophila nasuta]
MFKNSARLVSLFAWLAISLAHTITPTIKEGATDLQVTPFVQIGNGYYYFENTIKANWFAAFEACRRMDASLISLETTQEWQAIANHLNSFGYPNHYWTSGTDLAKQSEHVWFANGKALTIDAWARGQPDNAGNNEHCDHLVYNRENPLVREMNDQPCTANMNYICEARQPYTVSFVVW